MKILIIDNELHVGGYPQGLMIRTGLGIKGLINSIVKKPSQLTTKDFNVDKVILSGSTSYIREEKLWMEKEEKFIECWMKKGIPILGICFGAQLLAKHIFGKDAVKAMPTPISGAIKVKCKEQCPLFKGLPNPLGVVATHYEGFVVPKKYIIAETDEWKSYGFLYKKSVYGIQFHPELMGLTGRTIVKLQRFLFDRHVYQDFSIKTYKNQGCRIFKNFLSSSKIRT